MASMTLPAWLAQVAAPHQPRMPVVARPVCEGSQNSCCCPVHSEVACGHQTPCVACLHAAQDSLTCSAAPCKQAVPHLLLKILPGGCIIGGPSIQQVLHDLGVQLSKLPFQVKRSMGVCPGVTLLSRLAVHIAPTCRCRDALREVRVTADQGPTATGMPACNPRASSLSDMQTESGQRAYRNGCPSCRSLQRPGQWCGLRLLDRCIVP